MNIADTDRYRAWRAEFDPLFVPANRDPENDETISLTEGYSVRITSYHCAGARDWLGCDHELLDRNGQVCFRWRGVDTDGGLCTLIRHKNGNAYLLFRTELYGYSVREMESGREMHYVPASVHPGEGEAFGESFIWVEVAYDPRSDLLAVSGCFWGCPYSVAVVDFADPLAAQPAGRWLDVRELIDPGFDNFDDLDFVAWEDGALCLRGSRHGESTQEILLSVERLRYALTNARDENLIA